MATRTAPHDELREQVYDNREDEQDEREVDERRQEESRVLRRVLPGDLPGEGLARLEDVDADSNVSTDDHGNGDCLTDGASEAENHRRRDASSRIGEHDSADHLPARRP